MGQNAARMGNARDFERRGSDFSATHSFRDPNLASQRRQPRGSPRFSRWASASAGKTAILDMTIIVV
jgi:hypothetical protein